MKKYGMIFASVIFTLLIMFVPNQEVKADECIINLDYSLFSSNPNLDKIDQIDSFLKEYDNDIIYFIDASFTDFRVVVSPKSAGATSYASVGSSTFSSLYLLSGKTGVIISGSFSNFDTLFNSLKETVINQSYSTLNSNYGPSATVSNYSVTTRGNILYSTNYDNHYLKQSTICKLSIDDKIINFNEVVPTYYDYIQPSILINSNWANDLDGNDIEVISIDYNAIYDESYSYQYKTDFSDWIDITNFIKEASLYGYYYYQFNTYYNTLVEARVLDSDGNVVDSASYNVSDLRDYNDGYVYREKFSSSSHSDLKYITFQSNYNELNVEHKFRLQYLSNNKSISNIPNFIEYKAYIVDINGIILDYDFNEYFSISYDEYKLFEDDYETYLDGTINQIKELPKNAYRFKIIFEFDNLNNYTINVFDNYSKSTMWGFVQDFLKGYTRIKFPIKYDVAIIRSKNFNNISSSLIYMNVLFTSPEYGLNFYNYDFINKKQNYSYQTSDVTVDYSMISFDVNESNNVFPILFRNSNSDEVFIYLKDDCFIQFVNRENFESYIVGLDEDEFNNNNDLIVDKEFNDFIDDNFNFNNSSFFEKFSNGFDKFKSVITEIFQNISYFFERLCSELQYFYIVVFALIIFMFLIKFLL